MLIMAWALASANLIRGRRCQLLGVACRINSYAAKCVTCYKSFQAPMFSENEIVKHAILSDRAELDRDPDRGPPKQARKNEG